MTFGNATADAIIDNRRGPQVFLQAYDTQAEPIYCAPRGSIVEGVTCEDPCKSHYVGEKRGEGSPRESQILKARESMLKTDRNIESETWYNEINVY